MEEFHEVAERNVMAPPVKWNEVQGATGPKPKSRHGHRAVSIKDLIVIFGGGNGEIFDGLHVYNTATNKWSKQAARGEIPPAVASFGFVAVDKDIYMFGGMKEFGIYSDELFLLNSQRWEWKKLNPKGSPESGFDLPCARLGHSFTVTANQVAYVFGGFMNLSPDPSFNVPYYLNDLYSIDLKSRHDKLVWECPQTIGTPPIARESHTCVYVETSTAKQLVIYGGMSETFCRLGDVWILNLDSMTWDKPRLFGRPPLPRSLHTANMIGKRMMVYGGWVPVTAEPDVQEWKCTPSVVVLNLETLTWEQLPSAVLAVCQPKARAGHAAVVVNKRLFVWSGRDGFCDEGNVQVCCGDMWFLETEKPDAPSSVQMLRACSNSIEVGWQKVPRAESYRLEILKCVTAMGQQRRRPSEGILAKAAPAVAGGVSIGGVVKATAGLKLASSSGQNGLMKGAVLPSAGGGVPPFVDHCGVPAVSTQVLTYTTARSQSGDILLPSNLLHGMADTPPATPATPKSLQQLPVGAAAHQSAAAADEMAGPPDADGNKENVDVMKEGEEMEAEEPWLFKETVPLTAAALEGETAAAAAAEMAQCRAAAEEEETSSTDEEEEEEWFDVGTIRWGTSCTVRHYYESIDEDIFEETYDDDFPERKFVALEPGTTYKFRVAAMNALGAGEYSPVATFSTTFLGAPTSIKISENMEGIHIAWEPPVDNTDPGLILDYSVLLAVTSTNENQPALTRNFMVVFQGPQQECVVPHNLPVHIEGSNPLLFLVVARNEKGYGTPTEIHWLSKLETPGTCMST